MTDAGSPQQQDHDSSFIGTFQSLIVAFVLAMTFRGFVVEGFVIPTGSMAPTLLGEHKRVQSEQTGCDIAVGYDPRMENPRYGGVNLSVLADPMLGAEFAGSATSKRGARTRLGDRILVVKTIYPFFHPDRFDVVVFKNPTNPSGGDGNYIKRLIGLPGESIWLVDGDVFAGSADAAGEYERYEVQRKPEYIQRAVWQPIHHSDYLPAAPEKLPVQTAYRGVPWRGAGWQTNGRRSYRCDGRGPTELSWDPTVRALDDWAPYNMLLPLGRRRMTFPVHDIRVGATIVPDEGGLETALELEGRGHVFRFKIGGGTAEVAMRAVSGEQGAWEGGEPVEVDALAAGEPTQVEFWHVDQSMAIYVNGDRVAYYEYDWRPVERLHHATGRQSEAGELSTAEVLRESAAAELRWRFAGSAVTLHRVRVDRDLYYRPDNLSVRQVLRNPTNAGYEGVVQPPTNGRNGLKPAFGTHPDNLAILGPDQFFMLGDNSAASSDSRLWGNPHPLVARQIDPAPFVVDRRLLLGKAWGVYFPSPLSVTEGGKSVIPDFGRCRFIR